VKPFGPSGVLVGLLACGACAGSPEPAPGGARLNVLLILVDDLNTRLGSYGSPVHTPWIDRLASEGVRFDRAYCQYPLCNPSRVSLLTGRRPETTGVLDNLTWFRETAPRAVTLPEHFRANGYVALAAGKVFHGGDDRAWTAGGHPYQPQGRPYPLEDREAIRSRASRVDRWGADDRGTKVRRDEETAARAIDLLENYRGRPFFLAVGFTAPHVPLVAPSREVQRYDSKTIELPPDFSASPLGASRSSRPNFDLFIGREPTEVQAKEATAAYLATVSHVDRQVGRLLRALDRLELRGRTLVAFVSDHGFHLGEKGLWSKMSLFESAVRVPMILSAPGLTRRGAACGRTVELLDLYPTLVEACGLSPRDGLEGKSLVPLLKDPDGPWGKVAVTWIATDPEHRPDPAWGRSLRTERWRLTEWSEKASNGGWVVVRTELYDELRDPHERHDLSGDPEHRGTLEDLRRRWPRSAFPAAR
jgi:uncharacterized sulfatase